MYKKTYNQAKNIKIVLKRAVIGFYPENPMVEVIKYNALIYEHLLIKEFAEKFRIYQIMAQKYIAENKIKKYMVLTDLLRTQIAKYIYSFKYCFEEIHHEFSNSKLSISKDYVKYMWVKQINGLPSDIIGRIIANNEPVEFKFGKLLFETFNIECDYSFLDW